jgi:hypothetical protein
MKKSLKFSLQKETLKSVLSKVIGAVLLLSVLGTILHILDPGIPFKRLVIIVLIGSGLLILAIIGVVLLSKDW